MSVCAGKREQKGVRDCRGGLIGVRLFCTVVASLKRALPHIPPSSVSKRGVGRWGACVVIEHDATDGIGAPYTR